MPSDLVSLGLPPSSSQLLPSDLVSLLEYQPVEISAPNQVATRIPVVFLEAQGSSHSENVQRRRGLPRPEGLVCARFHGKPATLSFTACGRSVARSMRAFRGVFAAGSTKLHLQRRAKSTHRQAWESCLLRAASKAADRNGLSVPVWHAYPLPALRLAL